MPHVVGVVFEQLLTNPCLAQPNGIGDHHAVVTRQNPPCLFDGILLKFGQLDRRTCRSFRFLIEVVLEVFVQRFHIDFEWRVLFAAEL